MLAILASAVAGKGVGGTASSGTLAWPSQCTWQGPAAMRGHRVHDRRHTSLATVNYMARIRLGSTICSSSGRNHLRSPTVWVNNLANNASSGSVHGCRLGSLHQSVLHAGRLESTICISSGRYHRRWLTIWDDNLASNTSVSGSRLECGWYRIQRYTGLAIAMHMARASCNAQCALPAADTLLADHP